MSYYSDNIYTTTTNVSVIKYHYILCQMRYDNGQSMYSKERFHE